jgi:hypothetical protein
MPQLPIQLMQGQKADSRTQYVEALQVNVSGIVQPVFNSDGWMQQEPGLTQYGEGEGADRGGHWNDRLQMLFRVSGDSLISVDEDGTTTVLGTTTQTLVGKQASMTYSFNNESIVIDEKWFLYNDVDGARRILDPEVGNPIDHVWVDGYFFFTDGEYLYHTDIDDEEAIDPLKFASAEFSPDRIKGVGLTTDDKVIAFGRFSTEYFENVATEFFAFRRISSRTVQFGIVGTYCKAQIGGEWFFLGGPSEGEVSVYLLGVGTATNISCRAVDLAIGQYSEEELAEASLETRIINNYAYLLVRLPNETLMLNLKVAKFAGPEMGWSIIQSGTSSGNPYRAIHGVFDPRRAQWTYGDTLSTNIGYLDFESATHYDDKVECVMFTPYMALEAASVDQLMIQTAPGFTATDDATVFFSTTYNGVTWSAEHSLQYGAPSAYGQRFMAMRLGYIANFFAMKFRWVSESRMAFAAGSITVG